MARKSNKRTGKDVTRDTTSLSVHAHTQASEAVRRARGVGAVAGFLAAGAVGQARGVPVTDWLPFMLAGAIVAALVAWWAMTSLWRVALRWDLKERSDAYLAELQGRQDRALAAVRERHAAQQAAEEDGPDV